MEAQVRSRLENSWRRSMAATPISCWESMDRGLVSYSSWESQKSVMAEHACTHIHVILHFIPTYYIHIYIYSIYVGIECQSPPLCVRDLCPLWVPLLPDLWGQCRPFPTHLCTHFFCHRRKPETYLVVFHFLHFSNVSALKVPSSWSLIFVYD